MDIEEEKKEEKKEELLLSDQALLDIIKRELRRTGSLKTEEKFFDPETKQFLEQRLRKEILIRKIEDSLEDKGLSEDEIKKEIFKLKDLPSLEKEYRKLRKEEGMPEDTINEYLANLEKKEKDDLEKELKSCLSMTEKERLTEEEIEKIFEQKEVKEIYKKNLGEKIIKEKGISKEESQAYLSNLEKMDVTELEKSLSDSLKKTLKDKWLEEAKEKNLEEILRNPEAAHFWKLRLEKEILKEQIAALLKDKGWREEEIEKYLTKFEELSEFRKEYRSLQKEKGISDEEIEEYLASLDKKEIKDLKNHWDDLLLKKGLKSNERDQKLEKFDFETTCRWLEKKGIEDILKETKAKTAWEAKVEDKVLGIKQEVVASFPVEKEIERWTEKIMKFFSLKNICEWIADRFLPLLYFPAWKEMWKMRAEERRREILYASVGKIRNTFEAAIGTFAWWSRDEADYERRYQMINVKKEMESLASKESNYLINELKKAIQAQKMDRAEACVRLLQTNANFNEIIKDGSEELGGKVGRRWNPESCYNWLVATFGKKRANYMALDFAEDWINGIKTFDQMVIWNETIRDFEKQDPWVQAVAAAIHSAKDHVENESRKFWSEDMVYRDFNTGEIEPSRFLLARLAIADAGFLGRGLDRAASTTIETIALVYEQCEEFVKSAKFKEIWEMAQKMMGKTWPNDQAKEEDFKQRQAIALACLERIKARATGKVLREDEALKGD